MARNVFISFLGTQNYVETIYQFDDGTIAPPTRFIQEAILSKIAGNWSNTDVVYIFCTAAASKTNWENNGHEKIREEIEKIGLQDRLQQLNLKAKVEKILIKEGFSNAEIWELFQTVYSKLAYEDAVYLDITNAFRSIPVFSSTLLNYARFLKKITVEQILYGAFEKLGPAFKVYEMKLTDRVAPVLNLTNIEQLQQWTHAAQMFLETGSTRYLNEMVSNEENTALNHFALEIYEVRGLDIYSGESATKIPLQFEHIAVSNSPFDEIKNIVLNYIQSFKTNSLDNLFEAAKYSYNFNLIQQGLTILTELIITKVLFILGFKEKNDFLNIYYRNAVSAALSLKKKENFDFTKFEKGGVIDTNIYTIVDGVFKLHEKNKISEFYKSLTEGARNDINHSGFRIQAKNVGYFKEKLSEYIQKYERYFLHLNEISITESVIVAPMLINLSNHPSSTWNNEQIQAAAEQFGEVVDVPFPDIDPQWNAEQIEQLADEYLLKIEKMAVEHQAKPTVHLMGEYTFCFALVRKLQTIGINCVVSTSQRQATLNPDGTKTIAFNFVQFRPYSF
jgi:CRISPR-associated Csx2 family protein